jgi:hypothetical protein
MGPQGMQANAYINGPDCSMCLCQVFSLSMDCHSADRHAGDTREAHWHRPVTGNKFSNRVTIALHENDNRSTEIPLASETGRSVVHMGWLNK